VVRRSEALRTKVVKNPWDFWPRAIRACVQYWRARHTPAWRITKARKLAWRFE
jgi:hypothetical protein